MIQSPFSKLKDVQLFRCSGNQFLGSLLNQSLKLKSLTLEGRNGNLPYLNFVNNDLDISILKMENYFVQDQNNCNFLSHCKNLQTLELEEVDVELLNVPQHALSPKKLTLGNNINSFQQLSPLFLTLEVLEVSCINVIPASLQFDFPKLEHLSWDFGFDILQTAPNLKVNNLFFSDS